MTSTLHVSQDHHGFWMISCEDGAGRLTLESFQAVFRAHAWDDANHLVTEGRYPGALICIDAPRLPERRPDPATWPADYHRPEPQKCRSHGH